MLCSKNTGKFLSKTYHDERAKAVEDKTHYTADEQLYLDISGSEGTSRHQDSSFRIDTRPIGETSFKTLEEELEEIDIRLLKKMGGNI